MPTEATIAAAATLAATVFSRPDGSKDEQAMRDIVSLYKRLVRRVESANAQLEAEAIGQTGNPASASLDRVGAG